MEILIYSDAHNDFRQRLRAFLEIEVIPFVDQWEKDKIIPRDIWRKTGKAGFLCPCVFRALPSTTVVCEHVFPKAYAPAYMGFVKIFKTAW